MKKYKLITEDQKKQLVRDGEFTIRVDTELSNAEVLTLAGAVGYAQTEHIRVKKFDAYGKVVDLGEVYILDGSTYIEIVLPFSCSIRTDLSSAITDFINKARKYITVGVFHKKGNVTLGGLGEDLKVDFLIKEDVPEFRDIILYVCTSYTDRELDDLFRGDARCNLKYFRAG